MGATCSEEYYYMYTDHFKTVATYTLIDQRFIRVKHNGYPLCVICHYNITDTDKAVSECKKCKRIIGHEECITSNREDCPNCFYTEET